MSDQKADTRKEIEKTKQKLEILEEIDLLESEFGLIKIEYIQRLKDYRERLERTNAEKAS